MLSWKLWQYFDTNTDHLFYNIIKTGYLLRGYSCACGHQEIMVDASSSDVIYHCPQCSNSDFFNANQAHSSFRYFLENNDKTFEDSRYSEYPKQEESIKSLLKKSTLPIEYQYVVTSETHTLSSSYCTVEDIPYAIDFAKGKIISKPIALYRYELYGDGSDSEQCVMGYDEKIFTSLKTELNQYIRKNGDSYHVVPPLPSQMKVNHHILAFFLKNPWFKEFDFYRWDNCAQLPKNTHTVMGALQYILKGRNEKSVKKALFENYKQQLEKHSSFQTILINTVLETIKDPNLVSSILQKTLYCPGLTKGEESHLKELIIFLKRHYQEKNIAFFLSQINDQYYFIDLLREFIYSQNEIDQLFQKPKCTLKGLHDEFSRCARFIHAKRIFCSPISYKNQQEKAQAKVLEYDIKLPFTGKELFDWSKQLHNCMSGYFNEIEENTTTIYGFFKDDTIEFAVEIAHKMIIQAKGICNKELTHVQNEALKTWFHRFINI